MQRMMVLRVVRSDLRRRDAVRARASPKRSLCDDRRLPPLMRFHGNPAYFFHKERLRSPPVAPLSCDCSGMPWIACDSGSEFVGMRRTPSGGDRNARMRQQVGLFCSPSRALRPSRCRPPFQEFDPNKKNHALRTSAVAPSLRAALVSPIPCRLRARGNLFARMKPLPEWIVTIISETCVARRDGGGSWVPKVCGFFWGRICGRGGLIDGRGAWEGLQERPLTIGFSSILSAAFRSVALDLTSQSDKASERHAMSRGPVPGPFGPRSPPLGFWTVTQMASGRMDRRQIGSAPSPRPRTTPSVLFGELPHV